jgi:HK97 family phage portal protein
MNALMPFTALFDRRSYTQTLPWPKDPGLAKLWGYGEPTWAEMPVTMESAFTYSAVFDAVRTGSSDVGKLPLNLRKRLQTGGSDVFDGSKTQRLVKYEANPEMSPMVFRRTLTAHAMASHGGYAEIQRNGLDEPIALWPLTPDRVQPFREKIADTSPRGYRLSGLRYKIDGDAKHIIDDANMIHIQGLGYDGYIGYELVTKARQAIALALAAERFGARFFSTGASFGGILLSDQPRPEGEDETALVNEIGKFQQEAGQLRRFLTLFGGSWKFERTGVNPRDSQMDELRDKQVEEAARFFGMPLYKLKLNKPGVMSYNSVEMQDLDYYKGFLLNWVTLWEEELNRKLVPRLESRQQFFKHNVMAFLRGDIKSRYEALGIARDKGIINADEWRELEDMNPQEGGQGKLYLVQQAQVPLNQLSALVESQIKKNTTPKAAPVTPSAPAPTADDRTIPLLEEQARAAQQLADAERVHAEQLQVQLNAAMAAGQENDAATATLRERMVAAEARGAQFEMLAIERASERDRAQQARDRAETDRVAAVAARTSAEQRAETAVADAAARVSAAHEELAAALGARDEAEAARAAALAECESARALLTAAEQRASAADATTASAIEARTVAEAAQADAVQRAEQAIRDRDAATALVDGLRAAVTKAEGRVEFLDAEGLQFLSLQTEAEQRAEQAAKEVERLTADAAAALVREADARRAETEAAGARDAIRSAVEVLETRLTAADTARDAAEARATQAEQALTARETARADAHEASTRLQSEIARLEEERSETERRHQAELAELRTALAAERREEVLARRSLYERFMTRMIDREISRVHGAQATPAKLRRAVGAFYESHEQVLYEALMEIVPVHLSFMRCSEDPKDLARDLVHEHIAQSRRDLDAVLESDPESLAAALAPILMRWSTERPATFADRLTARELDYVANATR